VFEHRPAQPEPFVMGLLDAVREWSPIFDGSAHLERSLCSISNSDRHDRRQGSMRARGLFARRGTTQAAAFAFEVLLPTGVVLGDAVRGS